MRVYIFCCSLFCLLSILSSCIDNNNSNISFSKSIEHKGENKDEYEDVRIKKSYSEILKLFSTNSISVSSGATYQLYFYSSHGFGKSLLLERKDDNKFYLSMKCIGRWSEEYECENYQTEIKGKDWQIFESMINEYDFWDEKLYRASEDDMLDGYTYILVGQKLGQDSAGLITSRIVVRNSLPFDKINSLCEHMFTYESHLRLLSQLN